MANLFSFVIQTHSRTNNVIELLKNINKLSKFGIKFNIIVSDNGGRNKSDFESSGVSFKYLDNADCINARLHVLRIFSSSLTRVFYVHDDDRYNIENLLLAINYIELHDPNILVSPKFSIDKSITFKDLEEVFKMYFLDEKNNCPLFSGFYIRNMNIMSKKLILDGIYNGKYGDVYIMSRLLTLVEKSLLFKHAFLNYTEHDGNDNKIRNLNDREELSNYIKSCGGFTNYIISNVIFNGYTSKLLKFLFGLLLTLFKPKIFIQLYKKLIFKIKLQ